MSRLTSFDRVCRPRCHDLPDTQADRDLPRQPAAGARGQAAHTGQQTKVQAPKQAAVGGAAVTTVSAVSAVSAVTAVTAVTVVTEGEGAAVSSLGEACSRPLGRGGRLVKARSPFWKT